jgi:KDO2-lipid IV(A) lauroyltransferase
MWFASPRRRHITIENLRHAFPQADTRWIAQTARAAYANLGVVLTELFRMRTADASQLVSWIDIPNIERIAERMSQRQPSILLSGHYGNWELLAVVAAIKAGYPISVVVHPQHVARANAALDALRTRFGNVLIPMGNAARTIVSTLDKGGTVAFLADQYADPRHHRPVSFFGRPTPTYEAPAQLALKYGIPLFAAFAERTHHGSYIAPVVEVETSNFSYNRDDVLRCTVRHVAMLEDAVRRNPPMWSWQHRRWRSA